MIIRCLTCLKKNRMKRLLFIINAIGLVTLASLSGCSNQVDEMYESTPDAASRAADSQTADSVYYWYGDKKIYLAVNPEKQYVVYEETPNLVSTQSEIYEDGGTLSYPMLQPIGGKQISQNHLRWGVTSSSQVSILQTRSNSSIVYHAPYYISASGEEVGISHLFYVKLKSKADESKLVQLAEKHNVEVLGYNKYLPLWYTLSCTDQSTGNALQMANLFYETGLFQASEPSIMTSFLCHNNTRASNFVPNDPYWGSQWNLPAINWEEAYQLTQGEGITVAVVDEGIEGLHPDFSEYPMGFDTQNPTYDSQNVVYGPHGTACAGIIKATVNNGIGVAGIAPKVKIFSICHPFESQTPNAPQELATGLVMAVQTAEVVSCSWWMTPNSMVSDVIRYNASWGRNNKGTIIVFSTGNTYGSIDFPANCNEDIIAVGAVGTNLHRCSFSNYGPELDIVAPGDFIPTTDLLYGSGYEANSDYYMYFDGTSAACPHVAAVAALMLSVNDDLTNEEVGEILAETARKVGGYTYSVSSTHPYGTWNTEMGYGLLDAYAAVQEAKARLN